MYKIINKNETVHPNPGYSVGEFVGIYKQIVNTVIIIKPVF